VVEMRCGLSGEMCVSAVVVVIVLEDGLKLA
jgi:hypothetical protein